MNRDRVQRILASKKPEGMGLLLSQYLILDCERLPEEVYREITEMHRMQTITDDVAKYAISAAFALHTILRIQKETKNVSR